MADGNQGTGLQLRSLVKASGELELSLARIPIPTPAADEILVKIEGTPLNPSDLGLLLGPADLSTLTSAGEGEAATATAKIPPQIMRMVAPRVGQAMPVGNEGAGEVVDAGSDPAAQALIGKTVAILGGAMYAQYRVVKAADALVLNPGSTARDGASCFVNPLTALGMVGTMRMEGHTALVHTAAASNLGQMLVKICRDDGVELVNIVRSQAQADLLAGLGAKHVLDSTAPDFMEKVIAALTETGATIAFDAIGGGDLASRILTGMEVAANARAGGASAGARYGSTTYKQIYIYGGLDTGPTVLNRAYGMQWGLGGFLLTYFLQKAGAAETTRLRQRVADELKTTFASHYTAEISLAEALQPEVIRAYNRKTTGEKYLINPNKGL
ncbi:MAG TPA: zinc-binding dehydrogenase [Caulobacteraceae bacterium]|nr:zinc-binding dehydrogenase [Caulobacteraceae bacterium]